LTPYALERFLWGQPLPFGQGLPTPSASGERVDRRPFGAPLSLYRCGLQPWPPKEAARGQKGHSAPLMASHM
ncbi:hypothetical protein U6J74_12390, partial [Cutibacterium acnes]